MTYRDERPVVRCYSSSKLRAGDRSTHRHQVDGLCPIKTFITRPLQESSVNTCGNQIIKQNSHKCEEWCAFLRHQRTPHRCRSWWFERAYYWSTQSDLRWELRSQQELLRRWKRSHGRKSFGPSHSSIWKRASIQELEHEDDYLQQVGIVCQTAQE